MFRQIHAENHSSNRVRGVQWSRRLMVMVLTLALLNANYVAALAAPSDTIPPSYDEAYYATLDYYGAIQEGGVVKSYQMNGASTLTDYGQYDEVSNLTNEAQPVTEDDKLVFQFHGNQAPDRFYFEGKTTQPFYELPWTLKLSYQLNGVEKKAEDLAGASGLVEIDVEALPNDKASEYSRDNFVLQAMTVFNADDIISLDAPGAQVQMIGNLRVVLFMAMPGEEQHFAIRVGSEDFSFSGMTFLLLPATLSQLDQIADLREAKEKTADSFNKIDNSMDAILNALDGMSSSLNATADGIASLNDARAAFSAGKGNLYDSADKALTDLLGISQALEPVNGHLSQTSQALTDITDALTALNKNAGKLQDVLKDTRTAIHAIQTDTAKLEDMLDDIESYESDMKDEMKCLHNDLRHMGEDLGNLKGSLGAMHTALSELSGLSSVDEITYQGMTIDEVKTLVKTANTLHQQYKQYLAANSQTEQDLDFTTFLIANGVSADKADSLNMLWAVAQTSDYKEQIEQAETMNDLISTVNKTISEVNTTISTLAYPTSLVLADTGTLCNSLDQDGLSGDLADLVRTLSGVLGTLENHSGEVSDTLSDLDRLGDEAVNIIRNADTTLDLLDHLDDTVNNYVPMAQQALTDAKTLNTSLQNGIKNTQTFLKALEDLLKNNSSKLDTGMQQTLSGLAAALRQSTSGLNQTGNIRDAKGQISDLIRDEWKDHTGDYDNLFKMDAKAAPVSLTSNRNDAPNSVQILIRSQEIKQADTEPNSTRTTEKTVAGGSFFSRVGNMFQDFWHAITGMFHKE